MKIKHSKPKGRRILKAHRGFRPFWIDIEGSDWWFNYTLNQWVQNPDKYYNLSSSYYSMRVHGLDNIWSLKAAKRRISNWNVPKGTVFRVSLPWVGYEFYITK